MTFEEYCITGARQFLQTALVIDDRAELGDQPEDVVEPKIAVRQESPSFRGRRKGGEAVAAEDLPTRVVQQAGTDATALPSDQPVRSTGDVNEEGVPEGVALERESEGDNTSAAHLNAKALTDAFLAAEVICGVHKPTVGDNSVPLAVKAAKRADIVVVDWYLQNRSSAKAKAIIKGILKADVQERGRLRLVAIYTSEPGREDVAKDLWAALQEDEELRDRLTLDGTTLCSPDTRICIVNKEGTRSGADLLPVPETDLPNHLLREFVKLTDGLLANFAVSAVAAVRRGAHHVLARFRNQLDGVYLAHRISLKNPEEAEDMALERVSVELSSLVENANVPGRTLQAAVIDAWLEDRTNRGTVFGIRTSQLPIELMKELVRGGAKRLSDKTGQEPVPNTNKVAVSKKTIIEAFYPDGDTARAAAREFARLTSYKREVGHVRLDEFRPRLSLGALVKVRRDLAEAKLYQEIEGDVLLCVQPRCDSVRLSGVRSFPFQQAKYDKEKFNLIVDAEGAGGYLHLETRPLGTIMLRFRPDEGKDTILAQRDGGSYLFRDEQGRVFEWIGDLDDMKAQRFASDIGANMHRVGVDEFEWVRLGAAGDIKPETPSPSPTPEPMDAKSGEKR